MKYAVYCMTRNIYRMIIPSLKSLFVNSSVDKVFILAEDDDVGFWLPDKCEIINVSGQKFFKADSPNFNSYWTWMVMMRIPLCHILPPEVDKVLSLDLDTVITQNIDDLWDLPMDGKYIAGAKEVELSRDKRCHYLNCGVAMWNLDMMRDGMADKIIDRLNKEKFLYCEQDAMNDTIPDEGKLVFGSEYNTMFATERKMCIPKIIHFAGCGADRFKEQHIVGIYGEKPWEEVLKC